MLGASQSYFIWLSQQAFVVGIAILILGEV